MLLNSRNYLTIYRSPGSAGQPVKSICGYVPASEHGENIQEIGIIPVDAVYSPVVRVRYAVEETRVGQKTNYD